MKKITIRHIYAKFSDVYIKNIKKYTNDVENVEISVISHKTQKSADVYKKKL